MASSVDNESEILLGNKQLLVVFAVVALLLAVAFTGGYMLGKRASERKGSDTTQTGNDGSTALVTRSVSPDDQGTAKTDTAESSAAPAAVEPSEPAKPAKRETPPAETANAERVRVKPNVTEVPLGAHKATPNGETIPKPGETFVQVAALTRPQAEAMADVLRKQNFAALIAPKPGSATVYRVLVGPAQDAGEITATRDALRKIGFRDVIIQRY